MALTPADEARRRGLARMRAVATALLGFAAIVFAATLHRDGAWAYVNATAEAAMVGAVADWFAVTALFRHPLGVPIPHTALVPKKKDVFATSLEDFVTGYFLTGEAVRERFLESAATARFGRWLSDPQHADRLTREAAALTERALGRVEDAEVRHLVAHTLLPRLATEPLAPIAGALLEQVIDDQAHQPLVDLVVVEVHDWLLENPEQFTAILGERAPGWAPTWLNNLVTDRLHVEALRWVAHVRDDRQHRVRLALDDLASDLARNLQHDPLTMSRAEALKERLLAHPQTAETAVALWDVFRRAVTRALADPQGAFRQRLSHELLVLGGRLEHDPALRAQVDLRLGEAIEYLVQTYGAELATVISQVISRWDGREAAARIELHVGRDLQFIRINGTLVGGLVGLLIHTVSQLVG